MTAKMRGPFVVLHVATLDPATTPDTLADALRACEGVQDRHRLSEGAVYASGCRRYLLDTGTSWRASQLNAGATSWGGASDHRRRVTDLTWRCSCGADGIAADPAAAHAEHVAAATV